MNTAMNRYRWRRPQGETEDSDTGEKKEKEGGKENPNQTIGGGNSHGFIK